MIDFNLSMQIFGNTIQNYIISLAIFLLTVLAMIIANHFLKKYLLTWTKKTTTTWDELLVERIFVPVTYFGLIIGAVLAKRHLVLSENISLWADKTLLVLGLITFFLILIRFTQGFIDAVTDEYIKKAERQKREDIGEQKKFILRTKKQIVEIVSMILGIIAVLTILSNVGVNLKAVWASFGIGGIAIVVAVKDPLTNIVGRFYIFSTGIFDEDHFITFNNNAGTVKKIGIFRTYLELFSDMTTVSIPNADFIKGVVKNYYGRKNFIYKWDLNLPYDVSPQRIQELSNKLRELLHSKPEVNRDMCWIYLDRLDLYSKVVRVWFQVQLSDWVTSLYYGNQVLQDIQLLFETNGIDFALPTQTLHLKTENTKEGEIAQSSIPAFLPESEEKVLSKG